MFYETFCLPRNNDELNDILQYNKQNKRFQ